MGPFSVGQIPTEPQTFNFSDGNGNDRDLTGYTVFHIIMEDPDGDVVPESSIGTFRAVNPTIPNQLILDWNPATTAFAQAGRYEFQIKMIGIHGVDYSQTDTVDVEPIVGSQDDGTYWASPLDALNVTGASVSESDIRAAQGVIELVSGRIGGDTMKARDLVYLKKAVAYQATWMSNHPDIFTRDSYKSLQQDGLAATLNEKSSVYLAPLARRAVKSLSWKRSRSLRLKTPFQDSGLGDESSLNWQPL